MCICRLDQPSNGVSLLIVYVSLNIGYRSSFAGFALIAVGTRERSRLGRQVLGRAGQRLALGTDSGTNSRTLIGQYRIPSKSSWDN